MGYSHSYLHPEDACIESLATYPSDGEIVLAVGKAWDEAVALFGLLGIQVDDISPPPATNLAILPTQAPIPDESDLAEDSYETEAAALQHMIGVQQTPSWASVDTEIQDRMHMLTCAAIALDVEERKTL